MDEKLKALEAARLQIEKQFGQGSIMKLGSHDAAKGIDSSPPVPSSSTRPWASAAIPAAASSRYTAPNPRARRRSPSMR